MLAPDNDFDHQYSPSDSCLLTTEDVFLLPMQPIGPALDLQILALICVCNFTLACETGSIINTMLAVVCQLRDLFSSGAMIPTSEFLTRVQIKKIKKMKQLLHICT